MALSLLCFFIAQHYCSAETKEIESTEEPEPTVPDSDVTGTTASDITPIEKAERCRTKEADC